MQCMRPELRERRCLEEAIEGTHSIPYDDYKKCFFGEAKTVVANTWDDTVSTSDGKAVITHVLVRRFIRDPAPWCYPFGDPACVRSRTPSPSPSPAGRWLG